MNKQVRLGLHTFFSRVCAMQSVALHKHRKKVSVAWYFFIFCWTKREKKKLKITQISMQQNRTLNDLIGKLHASPRINGCYSRNGNRLKKRMCAAFLFFLMGGYTCKIFMFVQCNKLHCTNTREKMCVAKA